MFHSHHPARDKSILEYLVLSFVTLGAIVGFVYLFQSYHLRASQASINTLTLKLKLQGEFYPFSTILTDITLYRPSGKVVDYYNVPFSYLSDDTFQGTITFDSNFDFNTLFAISVKPHRYFSKLFCSTTVNGKSCTSPQFIIRQAGDVINLSDFVFYGGDIDPANGRVDAYDMSRIMTNLGRSSDSSTDINNDGITNTVDYILALYSLSNNIVDDAITLVFLPNPSATVTPYVPTITVTPFPTPTFPFPSSTPSYITPTSLPRCTRCTTAACGQCSDYATGWRCACSGYNGSTYASCIGIVDTNCKLNPTSTPIPNPTVTPALQGTCKAIPGPFAQDTCGVEEHTYASAPGYGSCKKIATTGEDCTTISPIKVHCSCPTGKVCVCQMLDKIAQTVTCTNGGSIQVKACE